MHTIRKSALELHPFQYSDVQTLLDRLTAAKPCKLLYQLPTGGGKTVIFSELTKRYTEACAKNVIVLTHRIELCRQTAATMERFGIKAK